MNRKLFMFATSLIIILTINKTIFADGKILIFSTPPESVDQKTPNTNIVLKSEVNQTTNNTLLTAQPPLYLVKPTTPKYVTEQLNAASRERASNNPEKADAIINELSKNLPSNLELEQKGKLYRFPIPIPCQDPSAFNLKMKSADPGVVNSVQHSSTPNAKGKSNSNQNRNQNRTNVVALNVSDHVNSLNKLMQTEDETIWNETFSADKIHCADQQTARRFKGYSDNVAELKFDVTPNTSVVAYYSSTGNVNERNQPVELFGAPDTRVLIAWNGKSDSNGVETMIVSTDEECKIGEATAMISVMPLPGKPIAIERANSESFSEAKRIINSRLPKKTENGEGPSAPTHRIVTQIIGSHNIFVLKASDVRDFCEQVKKYVERKYEGRASAWFDPDLLTVIDFYFQNGFRYFAFDLTEVGVLKEKEAIAYTFSSKFAYYPLVINRIGGNNDFSAFDLIIMSPCELTPNGAVTELTPPGKPAYGENQGTLAGGGCVSFSIEDVKRVAPSLNVFDSGTKNVYAYNVTFEKRLNSFTNDFTAIASTKKTTKSSALTSFDSYLKRVQVLPPGKTQNQNVEEKQPSEDDLKLVRVLPSDE